MIEQSHKSWRYKEVTPFTKNKFKGNNDIVSDAELDTTIYIYEPETLANLTNTRVSEETEAEEVIDKIESGGIINVNLVPYRELPEMKVKITSVAGSVQEQIDRSEDILAYTNIVLPKRKTKRFFSFVKLPTTPQELDRVQYPIYEENNYDEIINVDDTLKQSTFTFSKVVPFTGGDGSFYRDVRFRVEMPTFKNVKTVAVEILGGAAPLGQINVKGIANNNIEKKPLIIDGEFHIPDGIGGTIKVNDLYPHFLATQTSSGIVNFLPPWTWEWQYAMNQFEGDYNWKFISGGSNSNDDPTDASDGVAMSSEFVYQSQPVEYHRLRDENATNNGKEMEYFLPYGTEFALENRLSSHSSGYVSSVGTSENGLLGFKYSNNSHDGARVAQTLGNWTRKSTMFAWDYCYDGTIFALGGNVKMFMSKIQYGAFYKSESYYKIIDELVNGDVLYNGAKFKSDLGILEDIEDESLDVDIRKWNPNGTQKMLLLPYSITDLGGGDNWKTECLLDTLPPIAPNTPSIDLGLLDFKKGEIQTNDTNGFFGHYIRRDLITSNSDKESRLALELVQPEEVGALNINYYGGQTLKLSFFNSENIIIGSEEYPTEYARNKTMSGGVNIIWL